MSLEQMRDLLATVASFDGRAVDLRMIQEWHTLLQSVPHDLAVQAVRVWYAENRGYIQPNDIVLVAGRLAGLDRQESVTDRRLNGVPQPWESQGVGAPWNIENRELE